MKYANGVYAGDTVGLFKPRRVGSGKMTHNNGDTYMSEFVDGKLNGYVEMILKNGKIQRFRFENGDTVERF